MGRKGKQGISDLIKGKGFFGGHVGTGVRFNCDADDDSFFCTVSKIFQLAFMFVLLAGLFYGVYWVITTYIVPKMKIFSSTRKKRRR